MTRLTRLLAILALAAAFLAMSQSSVVAQTTQPAEDPAPAEDPMPEEDVEEEEAEDPATADRGMAEVMLNNGRVSVEYGRPMLKGRDMLSKAPAGFVWRFGSNKSTTLTAETDLMFGDQTLPKGSYSAWIKHVDGEEWALILNSEVGIWGAPGASRNNDVLVVPLQYSAGEESVESLTVALSNADDAGKLKVSWGNHRLKTRFSAQSQQNRSKKSQVKRYQVRLFGQPPDYKRQ